jgi:hypothetical protein
MLFIGDSPCTFQKVSNENSTVKFMNNPKNCFVSFDGNKIKFISPLKNYYSIFIDKEINDGIAKMFVDLIIYFLFEFFILFVW